MQVALIPWDKRISKNNIFLPLNDDYIDSHVLLKKAFQANGDDINTIDMYDDLTEVDYFLFHRLDLGYLRKLVKQGMANRCIYTNAEPPVVKEINSEKGYWKLKHIFPYIMTWNDELIDNKRIFKRNNPFHFNKQFGNIDFSKRKLLINVSGNKHSRHPQELYSEREKVVSYFERLYPDSVTLYGVGWDKGKHPSYQGTVENKGEAYHHHKFALSLENMHDVRGYVTEKILDCFMAGIVPIYQGASNIGDFVPAECYINYERFSDLAELADYLIQMDENEYMDYIAAIEKFLASDVEERIFSSDIYYRQLKAIADSKTLEEFSVSLYGRWLLFIWQLKELGQSSIEWLRRLAGKVKRKLLRK